MNPRHLDTRLGIVVTLFLCVGHSGIGKAARNCRAVLWLSTCFSAPSKPTPLPVHACRSLTALQFVIAAGLPSSDTVVPTQQLIIGELGGRMWLRAFLLGLPCCCWNADLSLTATGPIPSAVAYCILGGIGICSIAVFWMVNLHRTDERRRRLRQAQRQFTQRWASVAQSLGVAAASATAGALGVQQQASADENGRWGVGRSAKLQAAPPGPGHVLEPAEGTSAATLALPSKRNGLASSPSHSPGLAGGELAPQMSAAPQAAGGRNAHGSCWSAALQTGMVETWRRLARVRILMVVVCLSAGLGTYAADSSSSTSSGAEDSAAPASDCGSSPRHGGLRVAEAPPPVAAADEEDGAARPALPGWLAQPGWCGLWRGKGRGRGAGRGGGVEAASASQPGWLRLGWYKLRLMKEEMRRSQDYAMAVALRIDRAILWSTLVGSGGGVCRRWGVQGAAVTKDHPVRIELGNS